MGGNTQRIKICDEQDIKTIEFVKIDELLEYLLMSSINEESKKIIRIISVSYKCQDNIEDVCNNVNYLSVSDKFDYHVMNLLYYFDKTHPIINVTKNNKLLCDWIKKSPILDRTKKKIIDAIKLRT